MKTLPICIFTHNRTQVACATVRALLRNLKADGYDMWYILCDDRSKPGHVNAVKAAFNEFGVKPTVFLNDERRWGLGASMNRGLEAALAHNDVCLRLEDDWMLDRPLDVGRWASVMNDRSIGAVRLGMMFRKDYELNDFGDGLMKLVSAKGRRFNFNNQVALVHCGVHYLCGGYKENESPQIVERDMADRFNEQTHFGLLSPWICWPKGWARCRYYDPTLPFVHIGRSTIGNRSGDVPTKYMRLNDPEEDVRLRARFA